MRDEGQGMRIWGDCLFILHPSAEPVPPGRSVCASEAIASLLYADHCSNKEELP